MRYTALFMICLLFIPGILSAEEKTLVGRDIESGSYFGPALKTGVIDDYGAVFVGVRGGWVIGKTFAIGGGWYRLLNDVEMNGKLRIQHLGLEVEYIIAPDRLIHPVLTAHAGFGTARYAGGQTEDFFYVVEPGAYAELNVTDFFKIGTGVWYRLVGDLDDMTGLTNADLTGLSGGIICKWGYISNRGSGSDMSRERDLPRFHSIRLETKTNVTISQGSPQSCVLYGKNNMIRRVNTRVNGGVLTISANGPMAKSDTPRVVIIMEDVRKLAVSGTGEIFGEDPIETENMELKITGSGTIDIELEAERVESVITGSGVLEIEGSTDQHDIQISGSGDLEGSDLESRTTTVKVSGSGRCELSVSDTLDVKISGSGTVEYRGNPRVNSRISGSGSLIPED